MHKRMSIDTLNAYYKYSSMFLGYKKWASTLWKHIATTDFSTVHAWLTVGFASIHWSRISDIWLTLCLLEGLSELGHEKHFKMSTTDYCISVSCSFYCPSKFSFYFILFHCLFVSRALYSDHSIVRHTITLKVQIQDSFMFHNHMMNIILWDLGLSTEVNHKILQNFLILGHMFCFN
jgi:hypothetical protein